MPTSFPVRYVHNRAADPDRPYGPGEHAILNLRAAGMAAAEITSWPGYAPTPLVRLPALAREFGVAEILYKDEGQRFALGSFKALGGAYAVLRLLQARLQEAAGRNGDVTSQTLLNGASLAPSVRDLVGRAVFAAATDGNHGRSVAWGARMFGAQSIIYLHEGVSRRREAEIARYGASIRRVPGGYDESVRRCAADAAREGWFLVADTSAEGSPDAPILVMQGYTLIAEEVIQALPADQAPTHVFVPAGVGGLAAALAAHFWERLGSRRPRLVAVEPLQADCVFRSVVAGRLVPVDGPLDTFMACLAAGEVSPVAWTILHHGLDDAIALPDEAAMAAMRLLAEGRPGDPSLVAGESGSAALAGLISASADPAIRAALGLGPDSRVLLIGSEGATDRDTYERVVGRTPEAVAGGQALVREASA